ncbi:expressed unknown protein [Seminavis robusta]|uniref:ARM repeat-containing protein n=1 Tax=Seminavis robusta TaxID=568900 RepID=A0A9N8EBG6_9STRA|nr:expressed unknown protein [Seminavis robusta]|eukprot:Sro880_g214970.1 n/a (414) ;mRNA; r:9492-10904
MASQLQTARYYQEANAVPNILEALTKFPNNPVVQEAGFCALCNIANIKGMLLPMVDSGVIGIVADGMKRHRSDAQVNWAAMGWLYNLAGYPKVGQQDDATGPSWGTRENGDVLKTKLVMAGIVDLVGKGVLAHPENKMVQSEGIGALHFLANASHHAVVKIALLQADSALPALRQAVREGNEKTHQMMMGFGNNRNVGDTSLEDMKVYELACNALMHFGLIEADVLGDDDFDPDDNYDMDDYGNEYPIDVPPFGIEVLLNKDLLADDAGLGWYRDSKFCIDNEQSMKESLSLESPRLENLCASVSNCPWEGAVVYGGLSPRPACKLKTGTRKELLAALGTVHGHQVKAVVSLNSYGRMEEEKLRHAPLVDFFGGATMSYKVTLAFNDTEQNWEVARMTNEVFTFGTTDTKKET